MQQKYELGSRLTFFRNKNEKKISLNFIFVFEPLSFLHTYPSFLLSKFVSQIKLIQSVVGVSCSSQGLRLPFPGSWVSGPHVPGWQVPSPWVSGFGSRGPGSRVSGPDFRICPIKLWSWDIFPVF